MKKSVIVSVLGANGQLGQTFQAVASDYNNVDFRFYDRATADITSQTDLQYILDNDNPDYLINCAAYTAVDKAEAETDKCHQINVAGCINIAKVFFRSKTKVIHYSSDYVYNSFDGFPLKEDSLTSPRSIYASSKLEGDEILLKSSIPSMIIRTSWVVSPFGHNFVKTMLRLGHEKSTISVVHDQYGAPTYTFDLVKATMSIIGRDMKRRILNEKWNDIYNYANEGVVTWHEMASFIMKQAGLQCKVVPISSKEYPTAATRPFWSVMSKHKIKDTFHIKIPHWRVAIEQCIREILHTKP